MGVSLSEPADHVDAFGFGKISAQMHVDESGMIAALGQIGWILRSHHPPLVGESQFHGLNDQGVIVHYQQDEILHVIDPSFKLSLKYRQKLLVTTKWISGIIGKPG